MEQSKTVDSTNGESFQIIDYGFIGDGKFASVRKAKYIKDNISQDVALKIFKKYNRTDSSKIFSKEVHELRKTSHENIIKLIDTCKWSDKNEVFDCMIIELADMGSLHTVLYDSIYEYTFCHAVSWLYQIANAVNYLHSRKPKPTIHRDLKPLNLLLMKGGTVLKVCDFGTVTDVRTLMTQDQGSPYWMAPETLTVDNYTEKCDVYSYTIVSWELMTRQLPYFHLGKPSATQVMWGITLAKPLRPKPIAECPKILQLLYERGMDGEPSKRPSMNFILKVMQKMNEVVNKEPIKPLVINDENTFNNSDDIGAEHNNTLMSNSTTYDSQYNQPNQTCVPKETITSRTLSSEMLNGQNGSSIDDITDLDDSLPIIGTPISRDKFGRRSFKFPYKYPVLYETNPINNSSNNDDLNLIINNKNSNSVKGHGHRRSKSYGNSYLDVTIDSKDSVKDELGKHVETMLYEPLEHINNDEDEYTNESIRIYNEHRELINKDRNIQRDINNLRHQIDQLKMTAENMNLYSELLKQRNLLLTDNEKLRNLIN